MSRHVVSGRRLLAVLLAAMPIHCQVAYAEAVAQQFKVPTGPNLYRAHCSQCHGPDGTGNGPMAKLLTVHPADLTVIAKNNGGTFPAERVAEIIRYGGNIPGHGEEKMPLWGKVFSLEGGNGKIGAAFSRRAVIELKSYLELIQRK